MSPNFWDAVRVNTMTATGFALAQWDSFLEFFAGPGIEATKESVTVLILVLVAGYNAVKLLEAARDAQWKKDDRERDE